MLSAALQDVRDARPLIHCITNYVTVNDVANMLLACGASPVMADEVEEVAEIAAISQGLYLNMGTLNARTVESMLVAGHTANELGLPIVFDPVGAGASKLRADVARRIVDELDCAVIRANISELKCLHQGSGDTRGVDASAGDAITEDKLDEVVELARSFARARDAIVAISGPVDVVADAERAYCIRNGHPMMADVTGTGCQLSALTTAFVAASKGDALEAVAAAVCAMGLAGELAFACLGDHEGNASYRTRIIDAVYRMTPETLEAGARYELR